MASWRYGLYLPDAGSQQTLISSLAFSSSVPAATWSWPLPRPLAKQFLRCPPHGWQGPEHTRYTGDKHRVQAPDSEQWLFWSFNCSSGRQIGSAQRSLLEVGMGTKLLVVELTHQVQVQNSIQWATHPRRSQGRMLHQAVG